MCQEDSAISQHQELSRASLLSELEKKPFSRLLEKMHIIDSIDDTYGPNARRPKYQLYQAYRILGRQLQKAQQPLKQVLDADFDALACLSISSAVRPGVHNLQEQLLAPDFFPIIAGLDAILSCTKIAHDWLVAQQEQYARYMSASSKRGLGYQLKVCLLFIPLTLL